MTVLRPRAATPAQARPIRGDADGGPGSVRPAAVFADAALRRVLEVIDRRRSLAQLRPLMTGGLVDSLLTVVGCHDGTDAARLRRVRAQSVRSDGTAAEIAASYSRGERVHAIACRVEQFTTATGPRWQVVALHLG
ncbi:MAG: Rv3235 family protein [Mycobacteriaceae bacterium]